jgi:hypothetical protein
MKGWRKSYWYSVAMGRKTFEVDEPKLAAVPKMSERAQSVSAFSAALVGSYPSSMAGSEAAQQHTTKNK